MTPVLLCLHGWGGSRESFTELRAALKNDPIEILTPDLPGFGKEADPPAAWSTDDYARWVLAWLREQKLDDATLRARGFLLLGHSHGGRISIKLAASKALPIDHLFLCAAAGIRHPRHFKRVIGLTLAKTGKFFLSVPGVRLLQPLGKKLLYKLVRVHDYEKASPVMRETLIRVSAEDLRPLLSRITVPTDIFWGEEDGMTPVADAHVMHKAIERSALHTFKGVRHAVHREKAEEIAKMMRKFLPAR